MKAERKKTRGTFDRRESTENKTQTPAVTTRGAYDGATALYVVPPLRKCEKRESTKGGYGARSKTGQVLLKLGNAKVRTVA